MLLDKPPPHISALSWVVLDKNTKEILFGKMEKERREVASLTKLMTIYTVLNLIDGMRLEINQTVIVDESVNDVIGTSAMLQPGDILTVH
jgi:serine-type D-Ala-D-Ala carboxypeptidase (penicillin-binding protein 5/6)